MQHIHKFQASYITKKSEMAPKMITEAQTFSKQVPLCFHLLKEERDVEKLKVWSATWMQMMDFGLPKNTSKCYAMKRTTPAITKLTITTLTPTWDTASTVVEFIGKTQSTTLYWLKSSSWSEVWPFLDKRHNFVSFTRYFELIMTCSLLDESKNCVYIGYECHKTL